MELVVVEVLPGLDIAAVVGLVHGHYAVSDGPLGGLVVLGGDPLAHVGSVEEHNGVGGRSAQRRARGDDGRHGLVHLRVLRLGCGLLGVQKAGGDPRDKNQARLRKWAHRQGFRPSENTPRYVALALALKPRSAGVAVGAAQGRGTVQGVYGEDGHGGT